MSAFLLVLGQNVFIPLKTRAADCKDIKVLFADGSGAVINGTDNNYLDFKEAISGVLDRTGLAYDVYEVGTEKHGGFQYPAIGIGVESFENFATSVGAFVSAGEAYDYGESVFMGVHEVETYMQEISAECPNTKFILGGFSQGGGVISESLPFLDSEKIIYAATFGDAKLYLPEGQGIFPDACRGKNLSPYREYVPDCHVYQGILQGLKPYQPEGFDGKLGAWCNYHDMICSSYINFLNFSESTDPHGSYGNAYNANRLYYSAAEVIYEKVLDEFGLREPEAKNQNVAFMFDTTGSMSSLINNYKQEALRLATEVYKNGGKIALYEYRDLADPFPPRLKCNFETCTVESFTEAINNLSTGNGGDTAESVLSAALTALNNLNWTRNAIKSMVFLTDAGYHQTENFNGETIDIKAVVKRSLEIDPVNIYTITPGSIAREYQDLVSQTGGKSFSSANELSFSTDFILQRPATKLNLESFNGPVGDEFFFDASETKSESKIVKYEWDLDFDGEFELETAVPYISKTWSVPTEGFIQVKTTDENGLFGTMSAKVNVFPRSNTTVPKVENVSYEKVSEHEAEIEFSTDAYRTLVIVNGTPIGFTDSEKVTISDLDFSQKNEITLVPYAQVGYAGEQNQFTIQPEEKQGEIIFIIDNGEKIIPPKFPNCGRK